MPQEDGPLKGIISAGRYEGTLSQALHLFKYASRRDLAQPLGALLAGAVERAGLHRLPSLLVPVPLHPTRLAWRGYNQAALLAEAVAATLPGLTVNECLERRINTRTQIGLGGPERRANVREAFRMRGGGQARGRPVILVDDIWTTGSTMEECARVLKRWGSGPVWGAAVAAGYDRTSAPGTISG
ncbi:MAG: ComF family protein [Firmicutes bacterium]|nr:ComF family protein [Bacillota bacterium]